MRSIQAAVFFVKCYVLSVVCVCVCVPDLLVSDSWIAIGEHAGKQEDRQMDRQTDRQTD